MAGVNPSKRSRYVQALEGLLEWDEFLRQESGLPGPRANLELAQAVADSGDEALFRTYLALSPEEAPSNTPEEFLTVCGAVGVGRLVAEGRRDLVPLLRRLASDPRWRAREAVVLGLQRWGEYDVEALTREMERWTEGNHLERRAAAAALCEPRLLADPSVAAAVLDFLDRITESLLEAQDRTGEPFRILRQALGYCWSVAVASLPEVGKARMERWMKEDDPDILWIMRQNLKKKRLARLDSAWVDTWTRRLTVGASPSRPRPDEVR